MPLTELVAEPGVAIVQDGPLTCVQVPVPLLGVLPASDVVLLQMVWSAPAFALVGLAVRVIET